MAAVEVVVRLQNMPEGVDIEKIQDKVSDLLYEAGFNHIEPVGVTLITENSNSCGCG